jgi:hypothetical protein
VALADRGSAPTLVFDEIDTGVGGAVADAIGQRLKRLSTKVQVLSVTHAPQVAARAATHLLISKGPASAEGSEKIATRVATMEPATAPRKSPACWPVLRNGRGEGGCQAPFGGGRVTPRLSAVAIGAIDHRADRQPVADNCKAALFPRQELL